MLISDVEVAIAQVRAQKRLVNASLLETTEALQELQFKGYLRRIDDRSWELTPRCFVRLRIRA